MGQVVYIVTGAWDYEGGYILGVYDNEELAKKKAESVKEQASFSYVCIDEAYINQNVEISV